MLLILPSGLESLCNNRALKCGSCFHQQEAERDAQCHHQRQTSGQLSWAWGISLHQNQWKWETTHWFWGKKGNYLSLLFLDGEDLLKSTERITLLIKRCHFIISDCFLQGRVVEENSQGHVCLLGYYVLTSHCKPFHRNYRNFSLERLSYFSLAQFSSRKSTNQHN